MGRTMSTLAAILFLSVSAAAQGPAGPSARNSRVDGLPQWQVAVGYQYNRINLTGNPFDTNGVHGSVTRFFGRWVGLEGQFGAGFGDTGATTSPANISVKSLFVGGGPRVAYRGNSHIEPWIHAGIGMQHFRFTQTAGVLGSNTALAYHSGGGIDLLVSSSTAVRLGADVIGTRFFSLNQRHFQATVGLVFNF